MGCVVSDEQRRARTALERLREVHRATNGGDGRMVCGECTGPEGRAAVFPCVEYNRINEELRNL